MKPTIVDDKFAAGLFPPRRSDSHKGTYGTLVIVGGSEKYVGAPYLAALGASALRAGCGIVKIAAPEFLMPALRSRVTECTLFPLNAEDGTSARRQTRGGRRRASAVICCMGIGDTAPPRRKPSDFCWTRSNAPCFSTPTPLTPCRKTCRFLTAQAERGHYPAYRRDVAPYKKGHGVCQRKQTKRRGKIRGRNITRSFC